MSGDPYFDEYSSIEQQGPPEGFDTALICLNGHMKNDCSKSWPQQNSPHCQECGAKTISQCPECKTDIRGKYHMPNVVDLTGHTAPVPKFCHHCGKAYPWTASSLSAARELIREAEGLTENERGILERSLDDLIRETPQTPVEVLRFKRFVTKAGKDVYDAMKKILVDLATAQRAQSRPSRNPLAGTPSVGSTAARTTPSTSRPVCSAMVTRSPILNWRSSLGCLRAGTRRNVASFRARLQA